MGRICPSDYFCHQRPKLACTISFSVMADQGLLELFWLLDMHEKLVRDSDCWHGLDCSNDTSNWKQKWTIKFETKDLSTGWLSVGNIRGENWQTSWPGITFYNHYCRSVINLLVLFEGSSLRDLHHSPRVSVRRFSISNELKSEILRTGTLPIPFAHCRGKCRKVLMILVILVQRCQGFGCRLRMRTSDSPTRQGDARCEVIDHQRSARPLNWDCLLASVSLCLVLRNFSARFRWRRRAGGTFALAPEPFQGILRPRLP